MQQKLDITLIDGKEFPCIRCGQCCRHINLVKELRSFDNGKGICINLENNRCKIYRNRPDVCRGDYIYKRYFKGMPVDEFYKKMMKICELLKKEFF